MNILVIFATIEGQTEKIARFIEAELGKSGHEVTLLNADDETAAISFEGIDSVILAAPVHERRHPEGFELLLAACRHQMEALGTLLISVSLSAAFPEGLEEAGEYLTELKMRTEFTPDSELLVAGAVRASRYDYFANQVVRHVVLRGHKVDQPDAEHEFTDWDALRAALSKFATAGSPAD